MWSESLHLQDKKAFSSKVSRKESLLLLGELTELWINWSFHWMLPLLDNFFLPCLGIQSLFSKKKPFSQRVSNIGHFLFSVNFSLGISSSGPLLNDRLIDFSVISGFCLLAEIASLWATPSTSVSKRCPLPLFSYALRWSSATHLLAAI